jgi:pimeloyl-ACP methyl ester carboxylesterase
MRAAVRRACVIALIVLVVVLLVGATYQGVATALERREYPHPGQRIDVGGHQLHLLCTGDSRQQVPAVVLEAPETGLSAAWGWVQMEVSKYTRVCSYDRAGLGWSEAGDAPFNPARVPEELHTLLQRAKVPGPYVLVGQSLGAAFVRMFAGRYPGEVSRIILIDPPADPPHQRGLLAVSPWLARAGVLRASRLLSDTARGLPPKDAGALGSFLNRPDHLTRSSAELARWDDTVSLAHAARLAPDLKVTALQVKGGLAGLANPHSAKRVTAAVLSEANTVWLDRPK